MESKSEKGKRSGTETHHRSKDGEEVMDGRTGEVEREGGGRMYDLV